MNKPKPYDFQRADVLATVLKLLMMRPNAKLVEFGQGKVIELCVTEPWFRYREWAELPARDLADQICITQRKMTPPQKAEREGWVRDWVYKNFCADAVNQPFHEAYHDAFPMYARRETCWGAQPVAQAQKDLKALHKQGALEAGRIGLSGNWKPGFPKSVISYSKPRFMVEMEQSRKNHEQAKAANTPAP